MRRFLVVFAAAATVASLAAPAAAREGPDRSSLSITDAGLTPSEVVHGNKSASGRIAQSDGDLLARNDRELVNVMIKFDADSVAAYQGDIAGLAATSPSVTGKSLAENRLAVEAYSRHLSAFARNTRNRITAAVPQAELGRNFLTAYGGLAARLPANKAKALLSIEGVAAVQYDKLEEPLTDATPDFIGASAVWPSLGGSTTAGEGVIVGVLDTGIWPEHPSFADPGIDHPGGSYGCEFGDGVDPDFGADFTCNDKLIGAYAFVDTYLAFIGADDGEYCNDADTECSARDSDGHGTHTASTAAGNKLASAVLYGVERGPISGIAPGAHVIAYRVCLALGCFNSDSVAAVEQAIVDGVDVINFSISGGSNPYSDAVELAFLDAYAAGIMVNASAGNSGPDAGTSNHGGPWTNTIGASTSDRHFLTTLHLTADGGAALDIEGVTITAGIGSPTPVVLASAAPYSDELCQDPAAAATFSGVIVACQRGAIARVEKGYNVLQGGAAGMILYNVGPTDLETDNHYLPAVHVNDPDEDIEDFVSTNTGVMAWWSTGVASTVTGDVMASFSSRGPLGDFIKPDVTAPGIQILAGNSPDHLDDPSGGLGPDGELFQAIAGTSMSSPHAAGAAALVKAAHPTWTPGQIKSALMTSATQNVLKEDGVTPADPFDRGAGSIRVNRAVRPVVTFDVNPVDYYSSADDPEDRIHLNTPSINAPEMPGFISTTRTIRNVSGVKQTLDLTTQGGAGAISVTPTAITLLPGQQGTFTVKIDGTDLADGWYFGQITLNPRAAGHINARVPVAFDKGPGDVLLSHSCADDTVVKGTSVGCEVNVTNFASEPAHVSVAVKGPNRRNLAIKNWSAGVQEGNGFRWNGTLGPSLPPEVISLDTPGDGFVDIDSIPGEGFYGDETIANYDLTSIEIQFGDVVYDTIGVTSNGYAVVGGGGAADLDFIPQEMPDPTRPNNVLAPFWSDLDPGDGGDIHLALADDGTWFTFLVIQWDAVPLFGSCSTTCETRSFQIWIGTEYFAQTYNGGDDYITFEYDAADIGPGAGDGLNVGAEDALGLTAADLGVDTTQTVVPDTGGYFVNTGTSTPGGSMTITYDARGKRLGTYRILATMISDITQGTAREPVYLTVVP